VPQKLSQQFDRLLVANIAVVGMVQNAFHPVQFHMKTGAMSWFNCGPEMMKQRLDLSPVDVATDGILKDRA